MSCDEIQTQLPALLDGELTSETAAVIEAHLAGCARCSEVRDEIRAVLEMTRAWSVEGGDVLAGVQQQINRDDLHSLLLEMKRLRREVDALRAEVAELKIRAAKRVVTPGRETSALRFPYANVRDVTRPIL